MFASASWPLSLCTEPPGSGEHKQHVKRNTPPCVTMPICDVKTIWRKIMRFHCRGCKADWVAEYQHVDKEVCMEWAPKANLICEGSFGGKHTDDVVMFMESWSTKSRRLTEYVCYRDVIDQLHVNSERRIPEDAR